MRTCFIFQNSNTNLLQNNMLIKIINITKKVPLYSTKYKDIEVMTYTRKVIARKTLRYYT